MFEKFLTRLFNLNRSLKKIIIIALDVFIIFISFFISMKLRLELNYFIYDTKFWFILLLISPLGIISYLYFGLYMPVIRFISGQIIKTIFKCSFVLTIFLIILSQFPYFQIPRTVPFIFLIVNFIMIGGLRVLVKLIFINLNKINKRRVAIYGTNIQGRQLLSILYQSTVYNPIIFFTDDNSIIGSEINGLKVYSFKKDLNNLSKFKIDTLLVTTKNQPNNIKKKIINIIQNYPLEIKAVLDPNSIINSSENLTMLKEITIEDLLNREPIKPKKDLMSKNINNKVVFVSGAGGSIGSEICRQILNLAPKTIILFDHSEYLLYKIYEELSFNITSKKPSIKIKPILGSVQDENLLHKLFAEEKVSIVFHAAAYKHVNLVEKNIFETIKNNIFGTEVICSVSQKFKVENFILISSDKAVRPTNYMGATKRVAELICQSFQKSKSKTNFSLVRFGNVIGSSGSVIPKFDNQIKNGGPVTVTHKDVERYFMTIQEAAQLVIQSVTLAKGNDIFILDMGTPIKIIDLAKKMISLKGFMPYLKIKKNENNIQSQKKIQIVVTGLNKGEKLYEELMFDNNPIKTLHPRIMLVNEVSLNKKNYNELINKIKIFTKTKNLNKIDNLFKHSSIQMKK